MPQDETQAYRDQRAHALRSRYLGVFGGPELPVPVESIAEDLLGLAIEHSPDTRFSGVLLPAQRVIRLNAAETDRDDPTLRRFRFTIAHELGHWTCHAKGGAALTATSYCRAADISQDADRALEREANVFAAELLMPEPAVRSAWHELGDVTACASRFDVSPTAMRWRLYSFALVRERPAPEASP